MMDEQETNSETVVRQDAPGEDWLNGRQGACGACGKEDELYWNPLEGHVQCHACGYVNPEATRDTVLYLLEQRGADSDVIEQYQDDLEKAHEEIANARESEKDAEEAIRFKVGFGDDPKETLQQRIAGLMDEHMDRETSLNAANAKIEKLEADIKAARAKSKTAKVDDKKE